MDFTMYFEKETEKSYRCIIPVPVTDDDNYVQEKEWVVSDFNGAGMKSNWA